MRANIAELVESAFEEALHPRDRGGKWAAKIGAMKLGGRLRVGGSHVDKVTVAPPFTVPGLNKAAGWKPGMVRHKVTGGGREPSYHESAGDAAVELEKRLGSGGAPDPPATDFEATMRGLSATSSGPEPSPRRREGLLRTRTAAERASRGKPLDENERAALDWWHREGKQGLNDQERSYLQGFQIMGPGVGTRAMLGGTVPHPSSVARAARPAVDDLARRALEYTPPEVVERARRAVPRSRSTRPRELPGPAEQAAKANRVARERAARGMKFTKPAIREAVMDEMTAVVLEASISRAERDKAAKEGKALPDGSYPIRNARELSAAVTLARSGHGNVAAAKRHIAKRAKALGVKSPLQESTVDGAIAEAADSMAKASTPEPFSRSKTSNWVARTGGLPPYIQHIAHDLMEKRGKTESQAIQMAIGIVKNWASGQGKVHPDTRAAAAKAVAEWEAKKGRAKVSEADEQVAVEEADYSVARRSALPSIAELVEASFSEALHPRDRRGEFAAILGKLRNGHRDKGEAKMTAVLSGVNGHQVHRHNDGTAHTVDPQGHVAEHKNEADARKYANHNEPTTAASKPLGLGKAASGNYSHEPTGIGKTRRAHWDNDPKEAGVVGRRMIGESAAGGGLGGGKVTAMYHLANGGRKHVGDFSSHEEAHKAIVKAHERFAHAKRKTQEAADYGQLVEGAFEEALHPRDRRGEFASILGKLPVGSSTSLGLNSGVFVKRTGANQWRVNKRTGAPGPNKPKGQGLPFNSATSAAGHALSLHEQHFRDFPGDAGGPDHPGRKSGRTLTSDDIAAARPPDSPEKVLSDELSSRSTGSVINTPAKHALLQKMSTPAASDKALHAHEMTPRLAAAKHGDVVALTGAMSAFGNEKVASAFSGGKPVPLHVKAGTPVLDNSHRMFPTEKEHVLPKGTRVRVHKDSAGKVTKLETVPGGTGPGVIKKRGLPGFQRVKEADMDYEQLVAAAIEEAATAASEGGSDAKGTGSKASVFCVKDRKKVVPTAKGTCPECGMRLPKPKVSEAVEEAVQEALSA